MKITLCFSWAPNNNIIFHRMSVFQFIEDKAHPKTTVTYVNERPMLQYVSILSCNEYQLFNFYI